MEEVERKVGGMRGKKKEQNISSRSEKSLYNLKTLGWVLLSAIITKSEEHY